MRDKTVKQITKDIADKALAEAQPYIILEAITPGFGLRVGGRKKSWIVRRKFMGMTRRLTVGSYPAKTPDDARKAAKQALAQMENAIDPKEEIEKRKREHTAKKAVRRWTLETLWQLYLDDPRDQPLSQNTIKGYENSRKRLETSPFWKVPLAEMTPDDVRNAYDYLVSTTKRPGASTGGKTQASQVMRYARAVLRFGLANKLDGKYSDPFEALEKKKRWKQPEPRNRTIIDSEGDLARWWSAVESLRTKSDPRASDAPTVADYLILSLLWGGRRNEMLTLKWSSVDIAAGSVAFEASQTKSGRRHLIPLAPYARGILDRRWREREQQAEDSRSEYVFQASRRGRKTGIRAHINEPKDSVREVANISGVPFSPHDLRRTFGTLLGEIGASFYQTKAAMNHADAGDVTQRHYMRIRQRALKEVFTRLEEAILEEAGVKVKKSDVNDSISADDLKAFWLWKAQSTSAMER